jgi:hypothetical protein
MNLIGESTILDDHNATVRLSTVAFNLRYVQIALDNLSREIQKLVDIAETGSVIARPNYYEKTIDRLAKALEKANAENAALRQYTT